MSQTEGAAVLGGEPSRPMTTPEQLKQFQKDFEVIQQSWPSGIEFLKQVTVIACANSDEAEIAVAKAIMQKRRLAVVECGQALKRMHTKRDYLENYPDWESVCAGVGINPDIANRFITVVEALDAVEKAIEANAFQIVEPPRSSVDGLAAFAELRAALDAAPEVPVNEAEMPKPPKDPLKPRKARDSRAFDKAKDLLMQELADGRRCPVSELKEKAKAEGIGFRTLEKAKKTLGVQDEKHKGRSKWFLPQTSTAG